MYLLDRFFKTHRVISDVSTEGTGDRGSPEFTLHDILRARYLGSSSGITPFYKMILINFLIMILITSCATVYPASTDTPLKAESIMSFANWDHQTDIKIIKPGENWQILSQQTQIPISILKRYNHLKADGQLVSKQEIQIPARKTYKVKNGETAIGIAVKHGMTFSELINLNYLNPPYELLFGQSLKIIEVKKLAPSTLVIKRKPLANPAILKLTWPLSGKIIENFGPQANGKTNDAIQIFVEANSKVKAAAPGEIVYTGNEIGSLGNLIIIQHYGNWCSSYGHLDEIKVKKGDFVEMDEIIGYINKKESTDFGLYFGLRKGKTPVNPLKYLSKPKSFKRKK